MCVCAVQNLLHPAQTRISKLVQQDVNHTLILPLTFFLVTGRRCCKAAVEEGLKVVVEDQLCDAVEKDLAEVIALGQGQPQEKTDLDRFGAVTLQLLRVP